MEDLTRKIAIIGTGGFSVELMALLRQSGLVVEGCIGPKNKLPDCWLGDDDVITSYVGTCSFLIAIGNTGLRNKMSEQIQQLGGQLFTYIHNASVVANTVEIGAGSIIYPGAVVHADVCIGENVLINSCTSIGHETSIASCVNVSPGVSIGGNCKIGAQVHLGIGASIIENITISEKVIVGAGAVVIKDIETKSSVHAGVPASRIS